MTTTLEKSWCTCTPDWFQNAEDLVKSHITRAWPVGKAKNGAANWPVGEVRMFNVCVQTTRNINAGGGLSNSVGDTDCAVPLKTHTINTPSRRLAVCVE